MAMDHKARARDIAIKRSKQFAKRNAGTAELRRFIRQFEKFPIELRRELRPQLRAIGAESLARARANSSWSSRIPRAMKISVSFSKKTARVALTVNRKVAPHARPLENLGRPGTVRHPVSQARTAWASQPARPFFFRVSDARMARDMDRRIGVAVDITARKHGFR